MASEGNDKVHRSRLTHLEVGRVMHIDDRNVVGRRASCSPAQAPSQGSSHGAGPGIAHLDVPLGRGGLPNWPPAGF